jgi:y4mF family transcriptional regulator
MTKNALPHSPIRFFGMKELGKIIRRIRKARGLTQVHLAMQTGTSQRFISQVENGKESAEAGKVMLLIRLLDFEIQLVEIK